MLFLFDNVYQEFNKLIKFDIKPEKLYCTD